MRDISGKSETLRIARAKATLRLRPESISLLNEKKIPKGDPLPVAKVAAIQAAKNTSQIIPYCHPVPVDFVDCRFEIGRESIVIESEVKATYTTGVEMEALTAASVAALTIYDMLKMIDDTIEIVDVKLVEKRGGTSDYKQKRGSTRRAAVLVMSDSKSSGKGEEKSGKLIRDRLSDLGFDVVEHKVIPDEPTIIEETMLEFADDLKVDLVVSTGGTGLGPRDHAPEVTAKVIQREIPGIAEALRSYGQKRTPFSMLSRGRAGVRGRTFIINFPGSPKAVIDSLNALSPALEHLFKMIEGEGHPPEEK